MNKYDLNNLPIVFFQDEHQFEQVRRFCREIYAKMEDRHNSKVTGNLMRKYKTTIQLPQCPKDVEVENHASEFRVFKLV